MKRSDLFSLEGKVVLVTGGNQGLGLGAGMAFARAGAAVAIWGRRKDRNDLAAEAIRSLGGRVVADTVDVAEPAEVDAAVDRLVDGLGRVDVVFVNAGVFHQARSFTELSFDDYRSLLAVNLDGAFATMSAVVRHMTERARAGDPGGSIIVNGSLAVRRGLPGMEHYGAAKGGLASIVKGVATECGRDGIRANMVCPGFFQRERPEAADGDETSERLATLMAERCPIGRMGDADDLEGILVYLASDASRYHTGDIITIDGGWTATTI